MDTCGTLQGVALCWNTVHEEKGDGAREVFFEDDEQEVEVEVEEDLEVELVE